MTPVRVARTIVFAYCIVALWFPLQGYFVSDDYQIQTRAYLAEWMDPEFLLQPWGGHVMPGGFAIAQVLAKTVPFAYAPLALLISAGLIAAAWITLGLLRDLIGDRWPLVIAVTAYVACAGTWQAATWWTAALNAVPLLIAMPLAVRWHLRWIRGGSPGWALAAFGVIAAGMAFFEKTLLLVLVLAAFTVALGYPERGLGRAVVASLRRGWWLWPLYVVLIAATAFVYARTGTAEVATPDPQLADLMDALYLGVIQTYPAVVVGGPWAWSATGLAEPPWILVVISVQIVAGVALVQCLRSSVGRRLWALVALYLLAVVVSVSIGRLVWGAGIITQPRYFLDAAVLTIIVAAAAWGYQATRSPDAVTPTRQPRRQAVLVLVAVNLLLVGAATSITTLSAHMASEPGRLWTRAAVEAVQATDQPVMESTVPLEVEWELAYPDTRYTRFFAPVVPDWTFPTSTDVLFVLDSTGRVVPGRIATEPLPEGPSPDCGWLLADGGGEIRLPTELLEFRHPFRFTYLAGSDASAELRLGDAAPTPVTFREGLNEIYALVDGAGSTLEVTELTDGVVVCVSEVLLGPVEPVAGLGQ